MIVTFLTMLMLVSFFALIRVAIYFIQDKLEKDVAPPVTEEEKKAFEEKYAMIRRKILIISLPAFIIGAFIGKYGMDNEYGFLMYSGGLISFAGCIGVIARSMVAPKPAK